MLVNKWMTRELFTLQPEDSLEAARRLMRRHRVRHVPVLRSGQLAGVLSDRDIRDYNLSVIRGKESRASERLIDQLTVEEIMHRATVTVPPDATLAEAADRMVEHGVNCLPVVERGELVGLLTSMDILRATARGEVPESAVPPEFSRTPDGDLEC